MKFYALIIMSLLSMPAYAVERACDKSYQIQLNEKGDDYFRLFFNHPESHKFGLNPENINKIKSILLNNSDIFFEGNFTFSFKNISSIFAKRFIHLEEDIEHLRNLLTNQEAIKAFKQAGIYPNKLSSILSYCGSSMATSVLALLDMATVPKLRYEVVETDLQRLSRVLHNDLSVILSKSRKHLPELLEELVSFVEEKKELNLTEYDTLILILNNNVTNLKVGCKNTIIKKILSNRIETKNELTLYSLFYTDQGRETLKLLFPSFDMQVRPLFCKNGHSYQNIKPRPSNPDQSSGSLHTYSLQTKEEQTIALFQPSSSPLSASDYLASFTGTEIEILSELIAEKL